MSDLLLYLTKLLESFGWKPTEILGLGRRCDLGELPDLFGANVVILRPERGLVSVVWNEGTSRRMIRAFAERTPEFVRLCDLLEPLGLFPYVITGGMSNITSLPESLTLDDIRIKKGAHNISWGGKTITFYVHKA